jgi:uncharacterized protein (TIGR04255 family)
LNGWRLPVAGLDERLPERITPDAIIEVLVEFQIEHDDLAEAVIGRLLDLHLWKEFTQRRLPTADIPQPIRDVDPFLRHQPSIELKNSDESRVVKIGGHVLSYHIVGSYPGWAVFRPEIEGVLREVIGRLRSARFSRIGFRYINIFRPERHHVSGIADTNFVLRLGEEIILKSVNINYARECGDNHVVTVRIATPDMVAGNVAPGYSLLADLDVGSRQDVTISGFDDAMAWIEEAHMREKAEFFGLLPTRVISALADFEEEH